MKERGFKKSNSNPNKLGLAPEFSSKELEDVQDTRNLHRIAHKTSDVNSGPESLHHTLGFGPGQAAPGIDVAARWNEATRVATQVVRTLVIPSQVSIPNNARRWKVTAIGGGASGGGAAATVSGVAEAGGGGAGGVAIAWGTVEELLEIWPDGTIPIASGSSADGATAGNNNGNNGATFSFGTGSNIFCRATGGVGGSGSGSTTASQINGGGNGGSGTHGQVQMDGGDGGAGRTVTGETHYQNCGGGNAFSGPAYAVNGSSNGRPGRNIGGGSSGARNQPGQSARPSAGAAAGALIIEWYR